MENKDTKKLPSWVEQQKQQSAQIEILIASGFIYFLYQLPQILTYEFIEISHSTNDGTWFVLYVGSYIFARALLIGFVVILFLRALWLAYLGINYAYPQGIHYKNLKYSDYFNKEVSKRKNSVERILLLEKISSIAYSITIMFTLLSISVFLLSFIIIVFITTFFPETDVRDPGGIIFLLFFIQIGLLDLLFFGTLRKFRLFSKLYYPAHTLFRYVSFSYLYDYEWFTFLSYVKKWRVYTLFIVYFFLSLMVSMSEMKSTFNFNSQFAILSAEKRDYLHLGENLRFYSTSYENLLPENKHIDKVSIQSDIIDSELIKLFVVYYKYYDTTLDTLFNKHNVDTQTKYRIKWVTTHNEVKNDSLIQKSLNELFQISIDTTNISELKWYTYKHPKTNQQGFLSYIDISHIDNGSHNFSLSTNIYRRGKFTESELILLPFIKNSDKRNH